MVSYRRPLLLMLPTCFQRWLIRIRENLKIYKGKSLRDLTKDAMYYSIKHWKPALLSKIQNSTSKDCYI